MSQVSCAKLLCLGIVAVAGCQSGVTLPSGKGPEAGGSANVDSGVEDPNGYSNPDGGLVTVVDGGEIVQVGNDPTAPTCGASSFAAKQVVVEKVIEVPEEVTEEITEEVPEEVTVEVTEEVETIKPTTLFIMFDKSQSMNGGLTWGAHKWTPAVTALKSFVNDGDSAGLSVGLQFFPISGGQCSGNGYKTAKVQAGLLPDNAAALSKALDDEDPNGYGTPIEGALRGVTEYCKAFQASKPSEQCVAVLVTDGKPELSGCEESDGPLVAIASAAKTAGVVTFAVGLEGANFTLLNKIAVAGGAPDCEPSKSDRHACDVSAGADKLSLALNTIREKVITKEVKLVTRWETKTVTRQVTHTVTRVKTVQHVEKSELPCTWAVPSSDSGQEFDRNKVNIRLTSGSTQTTFVRVNSKEECRPNAWHFDDPSDPQSFVACEETCKDITGATDATIDILLGCATITPS